MPILLVPLIVIHVMAVISKLSLFFIVPRLHSVEQVRHFIQRYKPFERGANWVLWITGAGLLFLARWKILMETWMLVSIGLYLLVFFFIKFALIRELEKVADSKKLLAVSELGRLRVNNWCVGILSVVLLGVIAYLMMAKP